MMDSNFVGTVQVRRPIIGACQLEESGWMTTQTPHDDDIVSVTDGGTTTQMTYAQYCQKYKQI